jgi:hypothetical protein
VKCLAMWPVLLTNAHGGWGEKWCSGEGPDFGAGGSESQPCHILFLCVLEQIT